MRRTKLLDLNDELLGLISESGRLSVHDLLHLGRVNQRLHKVVTNECEIRWQTLCCESFPEQPIPTLRTARTTYKERYQERSGKLRLDRRVALLKLRSNVQTLQRDIQRLRSCQHSERQARAAALAEQKELLQTQKVQAMHATGAWVPSAVRQSWDLVTSQTPVSIEARLLQLEQQLKESHTYQKTLQQQERASKQQLQLLTRQLAAIEKG